MISIRRSFSAKVIMWVLLLAVPVFLASVGVLFWQSHKLIRAEAVDKARNVLACAMHRINRYLITTKTASHTNAWIVEQSLYPDSIQAITNRIATTNPYTDGCAISTEPGVMPQYPDGFMSVSFNTKDSINTFIEPDHSYFQERWYSIPRTQRKPTWVVFNDKNREQETDEDATIAAYTHPLFNKKGKFVGVISIWLSLQHISNIMAEVRPYPHSYYVMIDEKGRYVGHPDSTRLFNQTIFSVADPQHQADLIALGYEMTKGNKGSMSVKINGKKSLVCYMPVEGTPWSLAIVCPHSDILRGFYRLTYIVVALLIVGLLLIFINCHKAVTVSLSPLQQLLEKTKAVSNGHLDVDIAHTKRTDVIGGLQNSFATMLESLNYYINSVRTATDQTKRYNRELEHTTQLAVEAQRQKTIFIQNVTHQIRTPLNIIMGFAQILNCPTDDTSLSEELGQDEIKSIASTMTHNSRLLMRMVMMLFDSSDNGKAETANCDKREMVACNDVCQVALKFTTKNHPDIPVEYKTELADDFCIHTNFRYLEYSLEELLSNAVRYSDQQHISLHVTRNEEFVRFVVQDTGNGIAEADRDNIFKFFTKVDDFSEGLGLGLPLTKRHAETLGGNLILDTTYHEGSRFIFEIPVA
ncbi:Signal transduction histidine kinase [Xylanibacter ruminicola]|uniref:histidine kinase n=1 Tax=Xylanibacter ruminicola TaxID=839 RepID=A0A1M7M9F3_XYLRU|nr:ATP-binding protein [Xylanibacter ruminicola]SHM87388.1 Signal transduction histidine kinase [Xylanibacter ruminicola]